ncbi:hypothetical protein [Labedella endophytica]|uniref:hypothetical protein n=1 Tax=Labedella endophytica TaxID=1523160 RepID=UPI001AA051DF|nr:hypothetical protein [Labedella endophytica]
MTRIASTVRSAAPPANAPFLSISHPHRPLLVLAVISAVFAVVCVVGVVVDPREVLGQPAWAKPLKFGLSIAVYAVTLAWMIGLAPRAHRLLSAVGNIVVVALVLEMVVIVGAVVTNTTSHFNVSTPLATAAWSLMAVSIVVVWVATAVVAVALVRAPLGDPARALAIRAGLVIGIIGMGLAFLMTSPTSEQLNDFQGVAGAHAVGVADGGPGLPLLGWSTEGGDLRVPHFIGMHALQALPLVVIGLEVLARRVAVLRDAVVRARLVLVAVCGFAGLVAIVTWQALRGQSIVSPDALTTLVVTALVVAVATSTVIVLVRGRAGGASDSSGAVRPVESDRGSIR